MFTGNIKKVFLQLNISFNYGYLQDLVKYLNKCLCLIHIC